MVERTRTRQEAAYDAIRADILAGRLVPGEKLPFAELCSNYAVSVGVVREALSRLVEQGLVIVAPQQGYSVMPLSQADLVNLSVARREIETITLRHAMRAGDVVWESEVVAAHHRLANEPLLDADEPHGMREKWAELHSAFHDALLSGCENPRLIAIASQLRASAEVYRRWSLPLGHGPERDIPAEHRAIMEAVLARDEDHAVALIDAHIDLTTRRLLETETDRAARSTA